jgi:hypothetical protein
MLDRLQAGKADDISDMKMLFFTKNKDLMLKYKALQSNFNGMKQSCEQELRV